MLEAQSVLYSYGNRPVLSSVSLSCAPSGLTVLLGPNGSGKTTLLRLLAGVERPQGGQILLSGKPIRSYREHERARMLAYVPQNASLPFRFTVSEAVLMGRYPYTGALKAHTREDREAAHSAMLSTDIAHLAERCVTELSGGERRRVFLAQALTQGGKYLLLDEPVAGLDERHILSFMCLLKKLSETQGVLCVLHELELAARFADRLAVLSGGRIYACGTPKEILSPALLKEVYGIEGELFFHDSLPYLAKRLSKTE